MLTIRPAQLEYLTRSQYDRFLLRLSECIIALFDTDRIPDTLDTNHLDGTCKKAKMYGILFERDIAVFCYISFLLGDSFDTEFPWARLILTDSSISSNQKSALLFDGAKFELSGLFGASR